MNPTLESPSPEDERAVFALRCRAVRLHLAKNPNMDRQSLRKVFDFPISPCLNRLSEMGLVGHVVLPDEEGRRVSRYFVIAK